MKIATTIEQSQALIAAGINPKSADMAWHLYATNHGTIRRLIVPIEDDPMSSSDIPAWSAVKLGYMLPQTIKPASVLDDYYLKSGKYGTMDDQEYCIEYYKDYQPMAGTYIGCSNKVDKDCEDEVDCKVKLLLEVIKDGFMPDTEATHAFYQKPDVNVMPVSDDIKSKLEAGLFTTMQDLFGKH